jgi:hypothetical protein
VNDRKRSVGEETAGELTKADGLSAALCARVRVPAKRTVSNARMADDAKRDEKEIFIKKKFSLFVR